MANVAASDALKQLLEVFQKKNAVGSASPQTQGRVLPGQSMGQGIGQNIRQNVGMGQNQNLLNYRTPSTQKIGSPRPGMDLSQVLNFIGANRQPLTIPFAPGTKTLASRGFDESVKQNEIANQLARQAQAISAGNASRSAANQTFGQKMDIWRATGEAPEGIQGVAPGTVFGGNVVGQGGGNVIDPLDRAKLYSTVMELLKSDPEYYEDGYLKEGVNLQKGIDKWMGVLTQSNAPENNANPFINSGDPVQKTINQLMIVGTSPIEIRKALMEDGYDPKKYGY